jgi:genome maintenance exonuclease 1
MFIHEPVDLTYGDLICETLPTGRTYVTPEGKKYPSITTVLSILSEDDIREWRARVGEAEAERITRRAADRGSSVHTVMEKFIQNEPLPKVMPHVMETFAQFRPILEKRLGKIFLSEKPLYSDYLGVAGRVDLVAEFDGKRSIVDFKTSRRAKEHEDIHNYFMQETAYAIMFEERTGLPVNQLVTIMGIDGEAPKVFIERRDKWVPELLKTIGDYKRRKLFGHIR